MRFLQRVDLRRLIRTPGGTFLEQEDVIDFHIRKMLAYIFPGLCVIVCHAASRVMDDSHLAPHASLWESDCHPFIDQRHAPRIAPNNRKLTRWLPVSIA